jgi:tetratricopeptide (TPR) repeat protein
MTELRPESVVRLPLCTSEAITLSNLDLQLSNLRHSYAQTRRVDAGIQLVHGLLSRYSVSARDADLDDVDALTYALVGQSPEDPRAWTALAEVSAMRHRLTDAEQALLTASANGAPPGEVAEVRADLLEAVGEHRAALDIRVAHSGGLPPAQRLSRIACCQLALGAHHEALGTFTSALRTYADASPLPLGSMLFNWGHTWEHIGDRGRAELAYHAVIRYLPSHVRAHGALAEAQRVGRSHCATRQRANPDDAIGLGLLGARWDSARRGAISGV